MLLVSWAWAATAFLLPPGEAPEAWASAMRLADLTPGVGRPGAELRVDGGVWTLVVYTPSGQTRVVAVPPPTSARSREAITLLAASLLLEPPDPALPPPVVPPPAPPPPTPSPSSPPRPAPSRPAIPRVTAPPPPALVPPNNPAVADPPVADPPVADPPVADPPVADSPLVDLDPPLPSPPRLPWSVDVRVGATLRPHVAATPTVGAGVAWGPLRVGVEGGVAEEVVGATATLQRWSVDAGLGWSPSWVVGPDLAAGVAGAILHLRAADSPDQLAPTLAAWGDVGARWWPRPDVVVRVGARVGADLRAASVTTADGARVDLGRVWLTPAASLVVIFP